MGFVAGEVEALAGSQKVLVLDLKSDRTIRRIGLDGVADGRGRFLNDIVVYEHSRVAYIPNSRLCSALNNKGGLIVVDFATGNALLILDRHTSLGVKVVAHGETCDQVTRYLSASTASPCRRTVADFI